MQFCNHATFACPWIRDPYRGRQNEFKDKLAVKCRRTGSIKSLPILLDSSQTHVWVTETNTQHSVQPQTSGFGSRKCRPGARLSSAQQPNKSSSVHEGFRLILWRFSFQVVFVPKNRTLNINDSCFEPKTPQCAATIHNNQQSFLQHCFRHYYILKA